MNIYGGWNDGVTVMWWNAGGQREGQGATEGSQIQNVIFVLFIKDARRHEISCSIVYEKWEFHHEHIFFVLILNKISS